MVRSKSTLRKSTRGKLPPLPAGVRKHLKRTGEIVNGRIASATLAAHWAKARGAGAAAAPPDEAASSHPGEAKKDPEPARPTALTSDDV